MTIFLKTFNPQEDIVSSIEVKSAPLWSGEVNPLTAFYTDAKQITISGEYYRNVYDKDPASDNTATIQFAVAYGHINGNGSTGDVTDIDGTGNTPTKAIYSQYRNMLLPPTDRIFTFGSSGDSSDILVIDVARARYRQRVDPGNWELEISGDKYGDGSGANENPAINVGGRVFYIYQKDVNGVLDTSTVYGLFYPDAGIIMFAPSVLGISTAANLVSAISSFAARSEESVKSTHFFVRATNKEFNYTNNPTFLSSSRGDFLYNQMYNNPNVYVTTVGLYDNLDRLVAVAKLNQPTLKSFNKEVLIKVQLDY